MVKERGERQLGLRVPDLCVPSTHTSQQVSIVTKLQVPKPVGELHGRPNRLAAGRIDYPHRSVCARHGNPPPIHAEADGIRRTSRQRAPP
jgi:hypothetical protein